MLKSQGSQITLGILLAIGALELGLSGKFAKLWNLAFNGGANASASVSPSPASSGSIQNPSAANQQAHRSGS